MAREKPTMEQYVKAGAYYRLWKAVSTRAAVYIANNITQRASATNALLKTCDKVEELEVRVGLERNLSLDYPDLETRDFCSVFYGDVSANKNNDTDTKIRNEIINILNELINQAKTED